jgi:hypothetical protein
VADQGAGPLLKAGVAQPGRPYGHRGPCRGAPGWESLRGSGAWEAALEALPGAACAPKPHQQG